MVETKIIIANYKKHLSGIFNRISRELPTGFHVLDELRDFISSLDDDLDIFDSQGK